MIKDTFKDMFFYFFEKDINDKDCIERNIYQDMAYILQSLNLAKTCYKFNYINGRMYSSALSIDFNNNEEKPCFIAVDDFYKVPIIKNILRDNGIKLSLVRPWIRCLSTALYLKNKEDIVRKYVRLKGAFNLNCTENIKLIDKALERLQAANFIPIEKI